jgi:hypothetical protein
MFQAIFIFALILWIQAGLLRVREKYADWYAASHGARQVLADSFSVAQDQSPRESMVKRMFKFHPSFQERLEAVQNPSSLFRFPLMIAFIVGVLFALGLGGLVLMSFILSLILLDLNTLLIAGTAYSDTILDNIVGRLFLDPVMYIGFIAGLVGPLLLLLGTLSGILGIEGQREAVFDLLHGKPKLTRYLRVFVIALLVSLGIEIGLFLTPTPILSPIILFSDIVGPVEGSPEVGVLWTFLLSTMMIGGCLSLARFSTLRILAMHNGQKPPRLTSRLINLVLTILIWVFYLAIFIARNIWIFRYGGPIFFNVTIFIIVTVIGIGLLVASFAVIWAVDLLLRRKKSVNCPHCQKVTPNSRTMNRSCLHCGRDLAAWLFLPTEELDSG